MYGGYRKMTGEVFTNLKCILRAYYRGLVSMDNILGYMLCLVNIGYLKPIDVRFVLECLCSNDSTDVEWIFK